MPDVVVTGLGVVSSVGIGRNAFASACRSGRRGLEVPAFDPAAILGKKNLRSCDRSTLLLLCATELLFRELDLGDRDKRRLLYADDEIGISIGTLGSLKSIFDFDLETVKAPQFVTPTLFPNTVLCAAASHAAIRFGLQESCLTFSSAETSALHAFGAGVARLVRGGARHMVVGATHELAEVWATARRLACRARGVEPPALGEGAAVFSLEKREDAERAGHRPLAEVLGHASAFCPDKRRAFAHVVQRLRAQAGEGPVAEIGHLFSAQQVDLDEMAELPTGVQVHTLAPTFGHLSALTGALATARALADERIPADALVLVSTADPAGDCAALLLRKLATA